MKKFRTIFLAAVVLWSFGGCGGGSSNTSNNGNNGNQKIVIDNVKKAKNSFSVVGDATDVSTFLMDNIDYSQFIPDNQTRALAPVRNGQQNCALSGTVDYNLKADSTVTPIQFDVTLDFHSCQMTADTIYNGQVSYKGTENDLTIGFANFVKNETDGNSTLNLTAHVQITSAQTIDLTINGTAIDQQPKKTQTWTMTNWSMNINNADNSIALNGTVALQSNPVTCADGTYVVETVERVVTDPQTDDAISGKVKINDTLYTFNADTTVTATVNGQPVTFDQNNVDVNCSTAAQ